MPPVNSRSHNASNPYFPCFYFVLNLFLIVTFRFRRHRCPHRPANRGTYGPCTLSEYANKYKAHPMSPVQSCKPAAQAVKSDGPISDKTTHRLDYVPHPLEKPHVHQQASYKQPEGDIDATTMYQKDYTEKHGPPVKPIRREMKRASLGRFEGEPTYRGEWGEWECVDTLLWQLTEWRES